MDYRSFNPNRQPPRRFIRVRRPGQPATALPFSPNSSIKHVFFPFLRLPLEIRDKIYRNLLVAYHSPKENEAPVWGSRKPPVIRLGWKDSWEDILVPSSATDIHTSILATCKQIAFEATRILYTSNIVGFGSPESMSSWLDRIGPESVQAVQNVEICTGLGGLGHKVLENVLRRCTGLRRFRLDLHMMSCSPPRQPYICRFLESVKWVLRYHASLRLVASGYQGGYNHKRLVKGRCPEYWDEISITFLAETADVLPRDGFSFDIQEAIEQHSDGNIDRYLYPPPPGYGASAAPAGLQAT